MEITRRQDERSQKGTDYALRYPDTVQSLVLINPSVSGYRWSDEFRVQEAELQTGGSSPALGETAMEPFVRPAQEKALSADNPQTHHRLQFRFPLDSFGDHLAVHPSGERDNGGQGGLFRPVSVHVGN